MSRIANKLPSRAMVVAIVACVLAVAGTATAATGSFGLGIFNKKARSKIVGVGPLLYQSDNVLIPATSRTGLSVNCPAGKVPVGGGVRVSTGTAVTFGEGVVDSYPTSSGWAGKVDNPGGESHTATIIAICARASSTAGSIGGLRVK
jgi:hypothetical protein